MGRAAVKEDAATVLGPLDAGVAVLAVTNSSTRFVIPTEFVGRYCSFQVDGDSADIVVGDSTVVCTYGKTSTVDTNGNITMVANSGWHLEDGQPDDWIMDKSQDADRTHFAVCTSTGAAKLYIRPSGP